MKTKSRLMAAAAAAVLFVSGGITFSMFDVNFSEKSEISAESFELTLYDSYYILDEQGLRYGTSNDSRTAYVMDDGHLRSDIDTVKIPSKVLYGGNTYSVTKIYDSSGTFVNNKTIVKVEFDGFTESSAKFAIGNNSFNGCINLQKITLPACLDSIGNYAFSGCTSLKEIEIPDKTSSIYMYAFSNCNELTEVTIPESVKSGISEGCFSECDNLRDVIIKGSVDADGISHGPSVIYSAAFANCRSLEKIYIPESVKEISSDAFKNSGGDSGFTIYGARGSYAEKFAAENGYNFVAQGPEIFDTVTRGDMDCNGMLTPTDALKILQYVVGL